MKSGDRLESGAAALRAIFNSDVAEWKNHRRWADWYMLDESNEAYRLMPEFGLSCFSEDLAMIFREAGLLDRSMGDIKVHSRVIWITKNDFETRLKPILTNQTTCLRLRTQNDTDLVVEIDLAEWKLKNPLTASTLSISINVNLKAMSKLEKDVLKAILNNKPRQLWRRVGLRREDICQISADITLPDNVGSSLLPANSILYQMFPGLEAKGSRAASASGYPSCLIIMPASEFTNKVSPIVNSNANYLEWADKANTTYYIDVFEEELRERIVPTLNLVTHC